MKPLKLLKRLMGHYFRWFKLLSHYIRYISFKEVKKKQIVVCFDGLFSHGGLVDRLKGIVSFYQIAQKLDYDFKILFDDPFELDVFLEPNKVDWKVNRKSIVWHPFETKILYTVNKFNINPLQIIQSSKAQLFYVYANIDYTKKIFKTNGDEFETIWRKSFNDLFKKSLLLEGKLNEEIRRGTFISFHSRFTSLMGDFTDTTNKILSNKEKERLLNKLLTIIKRIKSETNKRVFVFSDSKKFISFIESKTDVKIVKGTPFHMDDYNNSPNMEGHLKTFIDFFILSKSEGIYFLHIPPMYNSSFSKYASIVGNTKFIYLES